MTCGIYTCLYDVDEDDEDQVKGLKGHWYFNENTDEGLELKEELGEMTVKMSFDKDTIADWNRRTEIAKIIDKDLTNIIGYPVTIHEGEEFISFDNDEYSGEWHKI